MPSKPRSSRERTRLMAQAADAATAKARAAALNAPGRTPTSGGGGRQAATTGTGIKPTQRLNTPSKTRPSSAQQEQEDGAPPPRDEYEFPDDDDIPPSSCLPGAGGRVGRGAKQQAAQTGAARGGGDGSGGTSRQLFTSAGGCTYNVRPAPIKLGQHSGAGGVAGLHFASQHHQHHHQQQPFPQSQRDRGGQQLDIRTFVRPAKQPSSFTGQLPAGMVNEGNTCYLNAVLQALLSLPCLVQDLGSTSQLPGSLGQLQLPKHGVTAALQACIQQHQAACGSGRGGRAGSAAAISPAGVSAAMALRSARWGACRQEDAHEFLTALLDGVQGEVLAAQLALMSGSKPLLAPPAPLQGAAATAAAAASAPVQGASAVPAGDHADISQPSRSPELQQAADAAGQACQGVVVLSDAEEEEEPAAGYQPPFVAQGAPAAAAGTADVDMSVDAPRDAAATAPAGAGGSVAAEDAGAASPAPQAAAAAAPAPRRTEDRLPAAAVPSLPVSRALCPASRNFSGCLQHTLTCSECGHVTRVKEAFNHLSLDLPAPVGGASHASHGSSLFGSLQPQRPPPPLVVDLSSLLANFFEPETCEKACDGCGAASVLHRLEHAVRRLPRVLVVQLKRFQWSAVGGGGGAICRKLPFPVRPDKQLFLGRLCVPGRPVPPLLAELMPAGLIQSALEAAREQQQQGQQHTGAAHGGDGSHSAAAAALAGACDGAAAGGMGAEQQQQWPKAPAKRLATLRQEASKRPKVVDGTHMGSFSSAAESNLGRPSLGGLHSVHSFPDPPPASGGGGDLRRLARAAAEAQEARELEEALQRSLQDMGTGGRQQQQADAQPEAAGAADGEAAGAEVEDAGAAVMPAWLLANGSKSAAPAVSATSDGQDCWEDCWEADDAAAVPAAGAASPPAARPPAGSSFYGFLEHQEQQQAYEQLQQQPARQQHVVTTEGPRAQQLVVSPQDGGDADDMAAADSLLAPFSPVKHMQPQGQQGGAGYGAGCWLPASPAARERPRADRGGCISSSHGPLERRMLPLALSPVLSEQEQLERALAESLKDHQQQQQAPAARVAAPTAAAVGPPPDDEEAQLLWALQQSAAEAEAAQKEQGQQGGVGAAAAAGQVDDEGEDDVVLLLDDADAPDAAAEAAAGAQQQLGQGGAGARKRKPTPPPLVLLRLVEDSDCEEDIGATQQQQDQVQQHSGGETSPAATARVRRRQRVPASDPERAGSSDAAAAAGSGSAADAGAMQVDGSSTDSDAAAAARAADGQGDDGQRACKRPRRAAAAPTAAAKLATGAAGGSKSGQQQDQEKENQAAGAADTPAAAAGGGSTAGERSSRRKVLGDILGGSRHAASAANAAAASKAAAATDASPRKPANTAAAVAAATAAAAAGGGAGPQGGGGDAAAAAGSSSGGVQQLQADVAAGAVGCWPQAAAASYSLTAVVRHKGPLVSSGHFVSDVRNHQAHRWFHYDDSHVEPLDDEREVATRCERDGYLFFYVNDAVRDGGSGSGPPAAGGRKAAGG